MSTHPPYCRCVCAQVERFVDPPSAPGHHELGAIGIDFSVYPTAFPQGLASQPLRKVGQGSGQGSAPAFQGGRAGGDQQTLVAQRLPPSLRDNPRDRPRDDLRGNLRDNLRDDFGHFQRRAARSAADSCGVSTSHPHRWVQGDITDDTSLIWSLGMAKKDVPPRIYRATPTAQHMTPSGPRRADPRHLPAYLPAYLPAMPQPWPQHQVARDANRWDSPPTLDHSPSSPSAQEAFLRPFLPHGQRHQNEERRLDWSRGSSCEVSAAVKSRGSSPHMPRPYPTAHHGHPMHMQGAPPMQTLKQPWKQPDLQPMRMPARSAVEISSRPQQPMQHPPLSSLLLHLDRRRPAPPRTLYPAPPRMTLHQSRQLRSEPQHSLNHSLMRRSRPATTIHCESRGVTVRRACGASSHASLQ